MLLYLTSDPRDRNVNDAYVSRFVIEQEIFVIPLGAGNRKYSIRITSDENADRGFYRVKTQRYFLKEYLTLDISFAAFAS